MPDRPNILILIDDEHRADTLGFMGNLIVRTPVLDRLARDAVVFDSAYTPSPICVPARQCLAVGQFPRTCWVECYGQDLPPDSLTFAKHFRRHGYHTVCCGKLHHDGPDQMQGWQRRIGSNCRMPFGHVDGRHESSFAGIPLRHDYGSVAKDVWEVRRAGVGKSSATHVPDELALLGAVRYSECHFADPYYDRHAADAPTLLMLSFNRPHYPYLTEEQLFTYYLNRVKPFTDERHADHPFLSRHRVCVGEDVTEREVRRANAAYYGMIEEADRDFGVLLETLDRVGQDLDNWIVIYTSDHGEMLGQHGVWEKQVFYEGSTRVPLFIRWPKKFKPGRVDRHVNLCDLFPTLCDLAGLPQPDPTETLGGQGLDGRSLAPLLHDPSTKWDNESISQFGGTNLMIRRDHLKYQWYAGSESEARREVLFDHNADPDEHTDFIDDSRYADDVLMFRDRRDQLGFTPE